jgi:hypothetical protein
MKRTRVSNPRATHHLNRSGSLAGRSGPDKAQLFIP